MNATIIRMKDFYFCSPYLSFELLKQILTRKINLKREVIVTVQSAALKQTIH